MRIEPVTLEGRYVRLIPLQIEHVPALWRAGADPDLWRFTTLQIRSEADMHAYIAAALQEQSRGAAVPFSTVDVGSGEIVGTTRFATIVPEHKRVEIGWTFVSPQWQRTAINTEAKLLMFRHAFETWGCNRVELKTNALNHKSRNAMLRVGCREEGTMRRHIINNDGTVRDTVYFSVIAEEWPDIQEHIQRLLSRPA
jgi:RimJ/RimL family protein N-acetyltransferase